MKAVRSLISRNLKLYFRDQTAVFFSLLAVLIVIVLYILFLADIQVKIIQDSAEGMLAEKDISYLVNSWILAGLLSITTVTSTLGTYGTMVKDTENRIRMDFASSPLKKWQYPAASLLSAFFIGTTISLLAALFYALFIVIKTGYCFTIVQMLETILFICLSSLMNAALMGLIVSFLKTSSAFSSVSLVIGTIIGFLTGLYVPLGSLPSSVARLIQGLPFMHIAAIFRQILTKDAADICFKQAGKQALLSWQKSFGVILDIGNGTISLQTSLCYVLIILAISLLLFCMNDSRKKRYL